MYNTEWPIIVYIILSYSKKNKKTKKPKFNKIFVDTQKPVSSKWLSLLVLQKVLLFNVSQIYTM